MKHYTLSMDSRRFRGLKKSGDGKTHIYTIRRGDTLWDIGKQYGVSVKQLCAWNGIQSRSVLRPGKKLNLWLSVENKNTTKAMPASYEKAKELRYTVKKGDSLWLIARRFNTNVKKLTSLNNLKVSKPLKPGQTLIIESSKPRTTGV
jgi:membrane-bound lytic murein transglycosylase D